MRLGNSVHINTRFDASTITLPDVIESALLNDVRKTMKEKDLDTLRFVIDCVDEREVYGREIKALWLHEPEMNDDRIWNTLKGLRYMANREDTGKIQIVRVLQ